MSADLKKWMQQWRVAESALLDQKIQELSSLTPDQARAASHIVLSLAGSCYRSPERMHSSGLIEQQRFFQNARTQPHLPRRA